jgi:hypothetical protein
VTVANQIQQFYGSLADYYDLIFGSRFAASASDLAFTRDKREGYP